MKSRLFEDEIVLAFHDPAYQPAFIDIGAGDGNTWSNSLLLAQRGWSGICFEPDPVKFEKLQVTHGNRPKVICLQQRATLANVMPILADHNLPQNIGLLSVDIDGFDAYITKLILDYYKPQFVIVEYNHMIPPPIRFCVNYREDWVWGKGGFFGCSIDHLNDLVPPYGYGLTHVMGGNAIFQRNQPPAGTPRQLWMAEHIPFIRITNEADSITLSSASSVRLSDDQKIRYVDAMFERFKGEYTVSLNPL